MLVALSSPTLDTIILTVVCLIGGIASTTVGTSGGFTFAAMASFLPASVVVPVHALVESTASVYRSFLLRDYVNWRFFVVFVMFGSVGIVLAVPLIGALSEAALQLAVGLFILLVTWLPFGQLLQQAGRSADTLGGLVTSFLTVFVGATGPLVAALLSRRFAHHPEIIATHAACMSAQHAAKVLLFVSIGWSVAAFTTEIVSMIVATSIGTLIGRHIILEGSQRLIKLAFKAAVTLLAVKLVVDALAKMI